ncbi:uncharacterized protein LOC114794281 [Denticeps clupeoides]|uniref:uncharacterized protein LOC114794281 n=1 Tax=Denticeps clupeoides TaxID=299321 RepID=UPI0010A58FA3|nr:uncharacterized protein LOC114794281 [Denticeps clupeoides]XP_028842573.1 uncharacterized protein LOC114794281 [Denticeps clupeoides]
MEAAAAGIHIPSITATAEQIQVRVGEAVEVAIYQPDDPSANTGCHSVTSTVLAGLHVLASPQDVPLLASPQQAAQVVEHQAQISVAIDQVAFAEVASLLDPNMKSSKARKYQIRYDEVKRRLGSPEKMSLRSLAAYTRVSRGPASKKTLLKSLNMLGLAPSTNTAVSSSFSKLTEGDTAALCKDMKDFASQYVDYENVAKQLMPDTNQVQHWSKIIETRNYLEEMRKCFHDPANSRSFANATHGLGNGMLDVTLDMVNAVIERQIRVLSGNTEPKPEDPPARKTRKRARRPRAAQDDGKSGGGRPKGKGRSKGDQTQVQLDGAAAEVQPPAAAMESSVLTLVSVGYETISTGLSATTPGLA